MLKQRVITALLLVGALAAILAYVPGSAMWSVFALIAALAGWEWAGLMKLGGTQRVLYALAILALCFVANLRAAIAIPLLLQLTVAFWLLLLPVWLRTQWRLGQGLAASLLGMVLLGATWAAMVVLYQRGIWYLLTAMGLVWIADICAYFAGRQFGKNKLAPSISPGKTWEGVAGAVIGVVAYGLFLVPSVTGWQWPLSTGIVVMLLVALTGVSVVGDLFESMLKRQAGLKDSSNMLPGHGGVLDRIDSLTSTLPVAALVIGFIG